MMSNLMRRANGEPINEEENIETPQISQAEIMAGGRPGGNMNGARQMLGLDNERPQGFGAKQMLGLDSPSNTGKGFEQMMGLNQSSKGFNLNNYFGMEGKKSNNKVEQMLGLTKSKKSNVNVSSYLSMSSKSNNKINSFLGSGNTNEKINNMLGTPKKNMRAIQPLNPLKTMGTGNNIIFNTEKVGWNRMKQQNNLPMFGDFDGDKVLNIYDCDPYDKNKQAGFHEMLSGIKNRFSSDKDIYLEKPSEEELQEIDTPTKPVPLDPYYYELEDKTYQDDSGMTNMEPVYTEEVKDITIPESNVAEVSYEEKPKETFLNKTADFLTRTGLIKTPEEIEIEKQQKLELMKIKQKAYAEALAKEDKEKIRYKKPVRKTRSEWQGMKQGLSAGAGMFPSQRAIEDTAADKMNSLMGIKQFGLYGTPMINEFRGEVRPMTGEQYYGVAPISQGSPTAQSIQQAPSFQQVQRNPQTTTYSPFSKRPVTYVRGPYNKRVVMQQPYALQQQSGY